MSIVIEPGRIITAAMMEDLALRGTVVGHWLRVSFQQIASTTRVPIAWDTTVRDILGARPLPPNNTQISPPRPGWYMFEGAVSFDANSNGPQRVAVWQRGSGTSPATPIEGGISRPIVTQSNSSGPPAVVARSSPIFMNGTSDYVQLAAIHNAGFDLPTAEGANCPSLTLTYLGPEIS